jgi:signal transduction histidine kinase
VERTVSLPEEHLQHPPLYHRGIESLVTVVQEVSHARTLPALMAIVRRAARQLTGADGATFVLRDGNCCYYADEDAIAPLWKGQRFPMSICISGWVMQQGQCAAIEDIYLDERIPADTYRPTFVKSLVMVPIRAQAPIGAIGTYWATPHRPTGEEVKLLQALADSTSIAMENVQLYAELEQRVRDRTAELAAVNQELESFAYSVSHDLRAPLRTIDGFSYLLSEQLDGALDAEQQEYLLRIRTATTRMGQLIDDLLKLAYLNQAPLERAQVNLTALAADIITTLRATTPERQVEVQIQAGLTAYADPGLLRVVLENLLGNAWKFTANCPAAHIALICSADGEVPVYSVRDNGAGFDPRLASKLFTAFQRLHAQRDFPGTGIGLATVQRIIHRHGGRIWAEGAVNEGATFYFTLSR